MGCNERYGLDPTLVTAMIWVESRGRPWARSPKGALGLMQVMPKTAADYGVKDAAALFDPAINVKTGTRHLKRLLNKYKKDYGRTIMAYNSFCVEVLGQPKKTACPIIPRFSNPFQTYQGSPLGVPVGVFFGAAQNAIVFLQDLSLGVDVNRRQRAQLQRSSRGADSDPPRDDGHGAQPD